MSMEPTDGLTLAIGGTALGAVCTLVGAWIKARYGQTKISPVPLPVSMADKYVTVAVFESRMAENFKAHENLFGRIKENEVKVGVVSGILKQISDDLRIIKNLLMKAV